jgi:hypothetical protein
MLRFQRRRSLKERYFNCVSFRDNCLISKLWPRFEQRTSRCEAEELYRSLLIGKWAYVVVAIWITVIMKYSKYHNLQPPVVTNIHCVNDPNKFFYFNKNYFNNLPLITYVHFMCCTIQFQPIKLLFHLKMVTALTETCSCNYYQVFLAGHPCFSELA